MQIGFILDIIIAVLLVLTITYAVRLNQRLSQLRSDKNELQALAKTFAEATSKAETGIQQLKISSEALQREVKNAAALRDDLSYLVERGGRTADQMVASVREPKKTSDADLANEEEDRLIEEAIRAATPGAKPRGGASGNARGNAPRGKVDDLGGDSRPATTRRISGHPEPAAPARKSPLQSLGGGLGGLSPEDKLLDDRLQADAEPKSIGDTDAARELLKALSSVK